MLFLATTCTIANTDCYFSEALFVKFGGHKALNNAGCIHQCKHQSGCEVAFFNVNSKTCFKYSRSVCKPTGMIIPAKYVTLNIINGKFSAI